ncbi:MAG: hypothetical protein PUC12_04940 [Clostridiales bacterium]|nr:hypothetical protein [Clostridiales bacterium]
MLKVLFGDDLDYYEECIMHLPDEEQERFFEKIQTLCLNLQLSMIMMFLLKDKMFRGDCGRLRIMREECRDGYLYIVWKKTRNYGKYQ